MKKYKAMATIKGGKLFVMPIKLLPQEQLMKLVCSMEIPPGIGVIYYSDEITKHELFGSPVDCIEVTHHFTLGYSPELFAKEFEAD